MNMKEIPNRLLALLLPAWALFISWSFFHPSDFISLADTAAKLPALALGFRPLIKASSPLSN